MSDLQFNISAKDQASKVVTSVQKKVLDFGKDIGRGIAAALGPIALLTGAFQLISNYLEDLAAKRKEAFDWGTSLADNAAKMGVTVEQFQKIEAAADRTGKSVDEVGKAFKLAQDLINAAKGGNVDAIASLRALGFSMDELDQIKPEEVLGRLAGAMSTAVDPTEKAAIAMAALGKEAKNLKDILDKGFDIAGAFKGEGDDDLSTEETALLKDQQRRERIAAKKEKVRLAKEAAAKEFLANDPDAQRAVREAGGMTSASLNPFKYWRLSGKTAEDIDVEAQASNPKVQEAIARIQEERKRAAPEATISRADRAAAQALQQAEEERLAREKAAKEAAAAAGKPSGDKPEDKPKDEKPKVVGAKVGIKREKVDPFFIGEEADFEAPTVSSLRSIGGAMAGESIVPNEIKESLEFQRSMDKTLKNIEKVLSGGSIDQTKVPQSTDPVQMATGRLTANA